MVLEYRLFHGRICIVKGMSLKDGTTGEEKLLNKRFWCKKMINKKESRIPNGITC